MLKVNEIFYSIQGEGYNVGLPAVFIRLSGCNLKCWFCDTDFASSNEMTEEEILSAAEIYDCNNIVITGGEPLLQPLEKLVSLLRAKGYDLLLETNGTIDTDLPFDWIAMSPKAEVNLKWWSEAKLIVSQNDTLQKIQSKIKELEAITPSLIYLQPCWSNDPEITKQAIKNAVSLVKRIKGCHLSLQIHKLIKIR